MAKDDHRITIRLGTLYAPLVEAATRSGRSLAAEVKIRLGMTLRVKPERKVEDDASGRARRAAEARWSKRQRDE